VRIDFDDVAIRIREVEDVAQLVGRDVDLSSPRRLRPGDLRNPQLRDAARAGLLEEKVEPGEVQDRLPFPNVPNVVEAELTDVKVQRALDIGDRKMMCRSAAVVLMT
jgi:hypothetical protein